MHEQTVREQERVVGPARARERRLLAVVHAFEEAGELQHVLGHPLTPLAAHPGARERLAQLVRVLRERVQPFVLAPQLVRELAERLVPIVFELAHELADLAELARHRDELLVDQALLAVELRRRAQALLFEQGPVRVEQARDELVRVGRRRGARSLEPVPRPVRRHHHRRRAAADEAAGEHARQALPMTMRRP